MKYGNFADARGLDGAYGGGKFKQPRKMEDKMQLYGILRRNGWKTGADLEVAAKRSAEVGDQPGSGVRWIRSYVLSEESGELGTFCVYEGESPETVRAHAEASGLPCDEVIAIADTVVVRPDPEPASQASS